MTFLAGVVVGVFVGVLLAAVAFLSALRGLLS